MCRWRICPRLILRFGERDACGIGFVARLSGGPSRAVLDSLLEALSRVRHRGAVAADHRTGDGAGVLLPLPAALLPESGLGLAMVFLRDPDGRRAVEEACRSEGIAVRGWRSVPVDVEALGPSAQATLPTIEQAILEPPAGDAEAIEAAAFRARKRLDGRGDLYVASLSFRTVVYKALCAADQLAPFYADLRDPAVEIQFGIFTNASRRTPSPRGSGRSRFGFSATTGRSTRSAATSTGCGPAP